MTMSLLNQLGQGDGGGLHDASCTFPASRCHRRCRRLGPVDDRVRVESAVADLRDGEPTQVAAPSLSYCYACRPPSGGFFMPGACPMDCSWSIAREPQAPILCKMRYQMGCDGRCCLRTISSGQDA